MVDVEESKSPSKRKAGGHQHMLVPHSRARIKEDTFDEDGEREVQLKKAFQDLNFSKDVDS